MFWNQDLTPMLYRLVRCEQDDMFIMIRVVKATMDHLQVPLRLTSWRFALRRVERAIVRIRVSKWGNFQITCATRPWTMDDRENSIHEEYLCQKISVKQLRVMDVPVWWCWTACIIVVTKQCLVCLNPMSKSIYFAGTCLLLVTNICCRLRVVIVMCVQWYDT